MEKSREQLIANNYSPTNSSINKILTDSMLYALNLIAFYTP